MAKEKIILSSQGLKELQEELKYLKEEKRVEIAAKLKEAISYGDLSENAEYQAARDEQAQIELRIDELEVMLKPGNYEIIDTEHASKKQRGDVHIGTKITLKKKSDGESYTYTIVGSQEADILEKKISNESPMGKALMGKKIGTTVKVQAPAGKEEYTIESAK
ncbi:transcription elongation factor GreA [Candidatus Gracilibacteria bacterium]|nr:MAG: transcription elongation factor GreA [Candidatus Gracilibacteria bacterium]